ncbi:hypothetical protein KY284_001107 [Solanum tuberosum]|nr:hypothetical protein KY284_001107 [Solanum tuberosum]
MELVVSFETVVGTGSSVSTNEAKVLSTLIWNFKLSFKVCTEETGESSGITSGKATQWLIY